MKRINGIITLFISAVLFILSFGATGVLADDGEYVRDHEYEPYLLMTGTRVWYDRLEDDAKFMYDELYDTVIEYLKSDDFLKGNEKNTEIYLEYNDDCYEKGGMNACDKKTGAASIAFENDNPQFYFMDAYINYDSIVHKYCVDIDICNQAGYGLEYMKAGLKEVERVASDWKEIINDVTSSPHSDVFKAYVAKLLVKARAKYTPNLPYVSSQTMHGLFVDRQTVCAGYTQAFQYICNVCGVDNVVTNEGMSAPAEQGGGPHAWNLIQIDGKWYNIDATIGSFVCNYSPDAFIPLNPEYPFKVEPGKYHGALSNSTDAPDYTPTLYDFLKADGYEYVVADVYEAGQKILDGIEGPYGWMYILTVNNCKDVELDALPEDERITAFKDWLASNSNIMCLELEDGSKSYMQYEPAQPMYVDTLAPFAERYNNNSGSSQIIWVNGDKTHKSATIQTSLTATSWKDSKGRDKSSKIVWLAMASQTEPQFDDSHKLLTKTDCNSIATVSSKGVVSAKGDGTVYVYAIDTGSMESEEFVVTVKVAPKKVTFENGVGETLKKVQMHVGETKTLFVKSEAGKNIAANEDSTYTSATAKAEYDSYIAVTAPYKSGKDTFVIIEATGIKNGKVTTAKMNVISEQSGKKGTLSIQVYNSVTEVSKTAITMPVKKNDTADIKLSVATDGGDMATTDKAKVYVSTTEPVINGTKVTVTKCSDIKATLSKDGKTVTVKAVKDVTSENVGIYIVYTNSVTKTARCFKIG